MNLRWLRLALAFLWLVPGLVLLVMEWTGGPVIAMPLGGHALPLSWPFLLIGLFNFGLWRVSRRPRNFGPARRTRSQSRTREPDERFRFDGQDSQVETTELL